MSFIVKKIMAKLILRTLHRNVLKINLGSHKLNLGLSILFFVQGAQNMLLYLALVYFIFIKM